MNFSELSQLSREFSFQELSVQLSSCRRSLALAGAQAGEVVPRILGLEEGSTESKHRKLAFSSSLSRVEADLAHLAAELEAFRDAKASDTAAHPQPPAHCEAFARRSVGSQTSRARPGWLLLNQLIEPWRNGYEFPGTILNLSSIHPST
jgi:hypothetical protein